MLGPLKNDVQLFFENPGTSPNVAGNPAIDPTGAGRTCRKYGILYHLRRNTQCCFETDHTTGEIRAPWPGAMCVMSGIDLLASFHAGTNEMRKGKQLRGIKKSEHWKYAVGTRFTKVLVTHGGVSQNDATVIYAFRNTLLHSFGVHDKKKANRFRLVAEASGGPLVQTVGHKLYCINLVELHRIFETTLITNYQTAVTSAALGSDVDKAYKRMYTDYGWMLVFQTATPAAAAVPGAAPAPVVPPAAPPAPPVIPVSLPSTAAPTLSGINTGNLMTICKAASGM